MSNAAQCYKATLSVTTGLSAPFNNLAIIYKQQVAKSPSVTLFLYIYLYSSLNLYLSIYLAWQTFYT